MIERLKPYTEMKSAGPEGLEPMPAHWEMARFKRLLRERDSRSLDGGEQLLRVSQYTGVTQRQSADGTQEPDTRAESLIGYKRVERRDLVVNIMLAWNGSLGVSSFPGIVSPAYCVYRFKSSAHPRYFHSLLRSIPYKARIKAESTGVVESRLRLYTDDLFRLEAHLPPPSEQSAIARFLDYMDRRIQKYIRAKQKLIALLDEYKQALIHQAVTGQIDVRTGKPYPEYKESGVERLRKVPKHWRIVPLKRVLAKLVDCEHKTAPQLDASEYCVIRTTAVRNGKLIWDGTYCTDQDSFHEWTRRCVPRHGDVILTREAPAGEACLVPRGRRVCLGQRTVLLRPDHEHYDPSFLVHMIYQGPPKIRIELASQGSTVDHFNVSDIGSMPVLLPTMEEQKRIVKMLTVISAQIDEADGQINRELSLLREFRTRLIADVVTGKLDVREAAAALPDITPPEFEATSNAA